MQVFHPIPLVMALCFSSGAGFSQEVSAQTGEERTAASRYFLGKENEFLMPVNILGPVNKPGQYMIPSETDVVSLVGGYRWRAGTGNERKRANQPDRGESESEAHEDPCCSIR